MKAIMKLGIAIALLALVMWACSKDSSEVVAPTGPETIDEVIASGGTPETVVNKDEIKDDTVIEQTIDNEVYYCTKKTHSITQGFEDFPLFEPNATLIWPGNLLQGATLGDATPRPIPVKRAGGSIYTTLMNGQDSMKVAVQLDVMSVDSVMTAANQIVAGFGGSPLTARTTYEFRQITSKHEFALALGANLSSVNFDVEAQFDYRSTNNWNRMMVKLTQSFYTIGYVIPNSYGEVFDASVKPADLAQYVGPGNPATFIESVTYGRIFYLLVQSTSSSTDVNLKVKAFVKGAVSGGGSVEVEDLSSLENLTIQGYALGGDAGLASAALLGDYQSVREFLALGGDYRTGVPLSYVVRSLARRDMIVKVKVNTEYDEISCVPVGRSLENPLFWYRADHPRIAPVDVGGLKCVGTWHNMFADTTMNAVPLNIGHYGGEFRPNALSSTTGPKPAILCYQSPPQSLDGVFKYKEDDRFINTDYTVFALVKLDNVHVPYPTYFMFGTSSEPNKNLSIGFWDERELVVSHQQQIIVGTLPISYAADNFNVYTFRFSKSEGMSIYVGLESDPIANDPNARIPLSVYVRPQFGSNTGSRIWIVELMAYGIAATDAQRLAMVRQISDRYIW